MRLSVLLGVGATACLLVLLPNCDSDSGGGDACSQYYDAQTAYAQRCANADPAKANADRARFLTVCANAINAPGVGGFAAALSACASQINAATCDQDDECDSLEDYKGTLADGAACQSNAQCASGECNAKDNQCGQCTQRVAVGQPCGSGKSCVDGATCAFKNGGDTGTCEAETIAKEGEPCSSTDGRYIRCDKGLVCSSGSDYTKPATCKAPGATGAPCASTGDCVRSLICVIPDGGSYGDGTCGQGTAAGGDCTVGRQNCARGLDCGADGKCAKRVYVGAGEVCDATHSCLRGSCKYDTSGGAPSSGLKGVCEDPIADGQPCEEYSSSNPNPRDCERYSDCVAGTCQTPNPANCK